MPPATCTCFPPDVVLGLAAIDCPLHGIEAQLAEARAERPPDPDDEPPA